MSGRDREGAITACGDGSFLNYVDEKDAPIQSPISSSRKPAERLRLEKEEQRNECALTFLIKKSEQAI